MLDHVSVGVRDLAAAQGFYDATLGALGYKRLYSASDAVAYGQDAPAFWVIAVTQPVPADAGSGLHVCFVAPSRPAVDAFHAAALGTGGGDNGAPGLRPDYDATYYAAFVTDPDGYRLEAHCGHAS